MDTSDYSFGYVASWSKDKELSQLKESMSKIRDTSNKIIVGIEKELEIGDKEQNKETSLASKIKEARNTKEDKTIEKSITKKEELEILLLK